VREPTGSALWLLERCPGQSVLPHYVTTSDAAVAGQKEHAELIPALVAGKLPDTPRGCWLGRQGLPQYDRGEVAYAIDLSRMTARELATEYARDYRDAQPGEFCLTVDLEAGGETAELKTGDAPVDGPRRNRQIQAAAVARWLAGRGTVRLRRWTSPGRGGCAGTAGVGFPARGSQDGLRDSMGAQNLGNDLVDLVHGQVLEYREGTLSGTQVESTLVRAIDDLLSHGPIVLP